MTRWIQAFNQHPFNRVWKDLLELVKSLSVDDLTVVTTVQELARLKKALAFVDGIISSVDPELTPMSIWANCQHQVDACINQVNRYNTTRNTGYLTQANEHVDNILTYVRPYMVHPKDAIRAYGTAVKAFSAQVSDYIEAFQAKASDTQSELDSSAQKVAEQMIIIDQIEGRVKRFDEYLFEGVNGNDPVEKYVDRMVHDIEDKNKSIVDLYNSLLTSPGSISDKVKSFDQEIAIFKDALDTLEQDYQTKHKDLSDFYERIFGRTLADDDETQEGSLKRELDRRLEQLDSVENEQIRRHGALSRKIESLLPGATSAGLASSYKALKDKFEVPIRTYTRAFYGAILTLILGGLILLIDNFTLWPLHIELSRAAGWEEMLRTLIFRLPVLIPIVWFAIFSATRRSQYERLQQEYAHKEAFASSYESYKKQLKELHVDADALQKELIAKAIEAISFNASNTLDGKHLEKLPIMQIFEKINIDELKKLQEFLKSK